MRPRRLLVPCPHPELDYDVPLHDLFATPDWRRRTVVVVTRRVLGSSLVDLSSGRGDPIALQHATGPAGFCSLDCGPTLVIPGVWMGGPVKYGSSFGCAASCHALQLSRAFSACFANRIWDVFISEACLWDEKWQACSSEYDSGIKISFARTLCKT